MAARLRPKHQDEIKAKIQGTQLKKLLEDYALTGIYNGVEINSNRIDAAKFLLNKLISNAPTEIEQKTEFSGNLNVSTVPDLTKEEWLAAHLLPNQGKIGT